MAYCAAFYCKNCQKRNPELSFFGVPSNPQRAEIFLDKIWRQDLRHKRYKSYRVCGDHFSDKMFMNSNRNKLVHDAYPDDVEPTRIQGGDQDARATPPSFFSVYTR